jgi:hypothetical protein
VTHNRFRRVLLVECLESGSGGGKAVLGFPHSIGQLAPTLVDVLGLVVSHGPTLRPESQSPSSSRRSPLSSPPWPATEGPRYLIELSAFPADREGFRDGERRVDGASTLASATD